MSKKRRDHEPPEPAAKPQAVKKKPVKKRPAGELPWNAFWRFTVSLLIIFHLAAVFCAPWSLATPDALPPGYTPPTDSMGRPQPPPPRDSVVWQQPVIPRTLHRFFHHYLNLLYLNHGYEFFAPDPSGTHVIDYQVTGANGQTITQGRFPNPDEQWPRLFYHRHMMLAEQTQLIGPLSGQHYAEHLATIHGGNSRLQLKVHLLLPPHRVAADTPLDAPSTYQLINEASGQPRPTLPTPQQGAGQ